MFVFTLSTPYGRMSYLIPAPYESVARQRLATAMWRSRIVGKVVDVRRAS